MSDGSDLDEAAHERMLQSVTGDVGKRYVKRETQKTTADDLLNAVTTKRNIGQTRIDETKRKQIRGKETLAAPLHRIARDRLQGAVSYVELKKEVNVWAPIVEENRVSDQLVFHEDDMDVMKPMIAADKTAAFYARGPKSDLEREMAEVLKQSKFNMTNDAELTEGEKEIIRAMDLKEAKAKLAQMRKMRALMSYKQANDARKSKIKSKRYHRIQKRQKRRQLLKEFEDLLSRDPEAAKEKLKELDSQRVFERATLKHGKGNAFNKELRKYASKNKEAAALLEDHLRLGRELKTKARDETDSEASTSEDEEDAGTKTFEQILKESAIEAAKAAEMEPEEETPRIQLAEAKMTLAKMRAQKTRELEEAKLRGAGKDLPKSKIFEENEDWEGGESISKINESIAKQSTVETKPPKKKRIKKDTTAEDEKNDLFSQSKHKDVVELFDEADEQMLELAKKEIEREKRREQFEKEDQIEETTRKTKKKSKKPTSVVNEEPMIDPKNFLTLETNNLNALPTDFIEKMDQADYDQSQAIALAFADDDVVGAFEEEKGEIEEREKGKDIDLSLPGWGSWTGNGVIEKKPKKNRFVIKAKGVMRKDKSRAGIIISEQTTQGITKLQPKTVPFPYTRMEDFEAAVRQPIGREWNSASAHQSIVRQSVKASAGRVIRPLNKKDVLQEEFVDELK
ncbi:unnamed protein product, partial [Mesorhabditis belari]|uniref:U3 small nucleolar RNA-associated protein 14 n=1 Tax=Mesorhabditis belari TaxID=2138241 RepID=A0AAF3ECL4_9BILA